MTHTAFITGGTRGIGAEITRRLLKKGFNVAVTYEKNDTAANAMAKEFENNNLLVLKCDASDFESTKTAFALAEDKFGTVDILINNAGIAEQKMFCDISRDDWDHMFNVNVGSMFNTVKCCYDGMVHLKWGRIINISSIWGISGASCEVHYSASKAAVIGFTKALAKELGPSGVCVNCVAPGVIATEMNAHLSAEDMEALADETPLCRIGTADDVASCVEYLISNGASFVTGQVISPNGGIVI